MRRLAIHAFLLTLTLTVIAAPSRVSADSVVTFNEIQYHPANQEDPEWIELVNQMAVDVDLSEWRIRGGTNFDFPDGTVIKAKSFLVIASDPVSVEAGGDEQVLGPWDGRLSNAGEALRLRNNSGRLMDEVRFEDRGEWPAGADGTGASLAKRHPNSASPYAENWVASSEIGGTPGKRNFVNAGDPVVLEDLPLLDWNADWRYNESEDLPAGWEDSAHAQGGAWKSGAGPLGFDTSALPVPIVTEVTQPAKNDPRVVTHYFEREFELTAEQAAGLASMELHHLIDDGAVFYLNGEEILRHEMPGGAIGPETLATSGGDAEIVGPLAIPTNAAVEGKNRISVEVHQNTPGSSDIAFGLTLDAKLRPPNPAAQAGDVILSEISTGDGYHVELTNLGSAAADLTGIAIAGPDGTFAIPSQMLLPGEFVTFDGPTLGFSAEPDDLISVLGDSGTILLDARRGTGAYSPRHPRRWLTPATATPGAPNEVDLHNEVVINEIMYHFREDPGTPAIPPEFRDTALVPIDATWRYNESGADLGSAWASAPHAVDGANWKAGAALLGAENNPADVPEPLRTLFDNPVGNQILTYYAEIDFEVPGEQLENLSALQLRHIVDDGAVFYLNGTEFLRFNIDEGPVTASTRASKSVGNAEYSAFEAVPADLIVAGSNRLSVEIHQRTATSSDVIFGAELIATEFVSPAIPATPIIERDEEWIELFNKDGNPVDLSGWSLAGGIEFTFPEGTSIAPGGFLVVAKNSQELKAKYPAMSAIILGDFSNRLNNARDTVLLLDVAGNVADEVIYYEGGRWPVLADGNGSSLELRDPDADNLRPEAWAASEESKKMPWQTIRYRMDGRQNYGLTNWREFRVGMLRAGEVLLDDISVVRDPDGDAEELIQNGSFESGPDTWRILGNHRHSQVIADPETGNRVLHLIAKGSTDTRHNHLETTFKNNTALKNSEVYEVSYRARWLSGSNQLNTRGYYQRIARTTLLDRPEHIGTPGAQNSRFEANIGPTYTALRHEPAIPGENEPVTIHAEVSDPDGLGDFVLRAKVDGEPTIGTFSFFVDRDGKGVGHLPGKPSGTVVQFWIEAIDVLNAKSMIPAAGPDSRALYQVEDGRGKDLPAHEIRVIMLDDDSDFMHDRFNLMSNEQPGGTAIYNGAEIFYDVGVRLRGSGAGRARDGNDFRGFRVAFPADHLFRGVHRSVGFDRSGRTPASKRQDEIYVKHLFNRAGIPCMYDDLVFFIPPTRVHTGTSIMMMAAYGPIFMETQFENGERGGVFNYDITYDPSSSVGGREGRKPPTPFQHIGTDLRDLGDDKEQYRAPFELRTGRRRDDYSGLINFCQVLDLPRAQMADQIDEWMNVDAWTRYTAMMALCGIGDTFILGGLQHNIRFYVPEDGRGVVPLPWDSDFVFNQSASSSIRSPGSGNVRQVFNLPHVKRLYWGHVQDLLNTTFSEDYMKPWLDHYGSVVGQRYSSQISYIRSRNSSARRQIPDETPFKVTTNGGTGFEVDGTHAELTGRGWVNIREFRLAGSTDPLPAQWLDGETWSVMIPLRPGPNDLELQSYDFQGALLDSHKMTISSLRDEPSPVDFLRITELHYNPAPSSGSEFIELKNIGTEPLDLGGVHFTDGITFTFAPQTILEGGRYIVVVRERPAFEAFYGRDVLTAGVFESGGLNNAGEQLTLRDNAGIVIHDFRFDDSWVASTDGEGFSLTVVEDAAPPSSWGNASHWRASSVQHGTPGQPDGEPQNLAYEAWLLLHFSPGEIADSEISGPDVVLNGDGTPNLQKFAFGLDPKRANPPDSLPTIHREGERLIIRYRKSRTANIDILVEQSNDLIAWNPAISAEEDTIDPIDEDAVRISTAFDQMESSYLRLRISQPE